LAAGIVGNEDRIRWSHYYWFTA